VAELPKMQTTTFCLIGFIGWIGWGVRGAW
jgi:hypothetical protein